MKCPELAGTQNSGRTAFTFMEAEMIRRAIMVLATLAIIAPVPVTAQEAVRDTLDTEIVRLRGFIRAAETQSTKALDLARRLVVNADGSVDTVFVGDTIFVTDTITTEGDTVFVTDTITVAGDTLYADDLVPDSAPPEWRVPEPEADSTSPPWIGDGRRLYTFWAWGDSAATWNATGDTLTIVQPLDRPVIHVWPVFQRDTALWVPSGDGWRPATIHPSRPWVCVDPEDEAESYSFVERVIATGIAVGLKVASWLNPDDTGLAQGLDRLPPDCPTEVAPPTDGAPPVQPSGVSLMGYVQGDDNGLLVTWSPAPASMDSVIVTGGPNGPGATFARRLTGTATEWRQPLAYDTVTSVWSCVRFKEGSVSGQPSCKSFNWAPM